MPLSIIKNDITKTVCDAIVNPTNNSLRGGGNSVDGSIHRIGGQALERECILLGGCETGKAKVTAAYSLPCKYIIHTVPPIWRGGCYGEDKFLASCYRESLKLCKKYRLRSVAFPIIASGTNGYPKESAFRIALEEIKTFLNGNEMNIYIVVYDPEAIAIGQKLKNEVMQYISSDGNGSAGQTFKGGLEKFLDSTGETFVEKLWRFMDEKGLKNSQCYKRANIDRKHFSKIQNGKVNPKKQTVLAFAVALSLDLCKTDELLESAGYALTDSDKRDLIVKYFIVNGRYDIYELNFVLVDFGLEPLSGGI